MLFVYRQSPSDSARELSTALECDRLKRFEGGIFRRRTVGGVPVRPRRGDAIICWGETLEGVEGPKLLNAAPLLSKFEQARKLTAAGVATVEVAAQPPPQAPQVDPIVNAWLQTMRAVPHPLTRESILQVEQVIREARTAPPVVAQVWLPRTNNHIGGRDLLTVPGNPNYFSKKENLVEEYRVHCFKGKSIRAGVKVPRDGATPHAWIRSFEGGWRIRYDGFESRKAMRELSAATLEALGLDFAAIDLGRKEDGSLMVLEANRAPGLEGGTVTAYATAITKWMED